MGLCVDADETPHNITFEDRRESVIFYLADGDVEISKPDLVKILQLVSDPKWSKRLTTVRSIK